jgi:hypothetical protein
MNLKGFIGASASTLYAIAIVASALYFPHALVGIAVIGAMVVGAAWSLPGRLLKPPCEPDEAPQDATSYK